MTHDNPTPLVDSAELQEEFDKILAGYGIRDPKMIKQFKIEPVTLAEARRRLIALFTQHHQALLQKIEEAMPKKVEVDEETGYLPPEDPLVAADQVRNYTIDQVQNILNQAREGKL